MIKTIGVLTSGGDAPGMNAAIRAVVRTAINAGLTVKGIKHGYAGLLKEDFVDMNSRSVAGILTRGGTILYTARCPEFHQPETQKKAAEILKKHEIDALVVIGGDGSFRGALALSEYGINVMGVPATIDMDLGCTEYTIGFDTAINTAMDCLDKIRDTSLSHERVSVVEVMGRHCGYIALYCGIANGVEDILLPEDYDHDEFRIIETILENRAKGKKIHIILNAEGIGDSVGMAERIEKATGADSRATILGYLQRGGSPTCLDRVNASVMGAKAIEAILAGKENRAIVQQQGVFTDLDMSVALAKKRELPADFLDISKKLIR
ncbi:MAG: 6-phosphofructokinase [Lachnospiraceae bacterium]|nr:6-phosphofructokinase [Candidatus Minthocola equi]